MNTAENKAVRFPGVKDGETFRIAGMEFIKFPATKEGTPVLMRDVAFTSRFGSSNDLRTSNVLKRLQEEFLPRIIEAVGEENVLSFQTDLTTLDGLKPYEALESKISLHTFDFYRANVEIFDKYPVDEYCWTATPDSAKPHYDPVWVVCVSPAGCVFNDCYRYYYGGVRPFLILNSSIFESSED